MNLQRALALAALALALASCAGQAPAQDQQTPVSGSFTGAGGIE